MQLTPLLDDRRPVTLSSGELRLSAELALPPDADGLVLFAHAAEGGWPLARHRSVARELNAARVGTLLFDLLTPEEQQLEQHTLHLRCDVDLLANRLLEVIDHVALRFKTRTGKLGLIGTSTGGAAALVAAAQRPRQVTAVVSRNGRPDLAGDWLDHVQSPTLLLVSAADTRLMELNRAAHTRLIAQKALKSLPGGIQLEEPGAAELATRLSAEWFKAHLGEHTYD